jgi:glyoxylase-like metal-dependent hydrolase (beta-lactamase superfamily II)
MSAPTITPLDTGWLRQQERTLVGGGSTHVIEVPVPSWLVRHPRGDVVFDVGLHPDLTAGSSALPGGLAKLFDPRLAADGTIAHRLAEHDVDPLGTLTVVVSHCHFDHVGGLCEVPNARLVVQAAEWAFALRGDSGGYLTATYDLGHDVVAVDGEHDVFGDGSVVCVPTPGHTCGHQSLRVVTADGPTILTADACYFAHTLDDGVLPPFGFDLDEQRASLDLLRRERDRGTTIVPGHDADVFRRLIGDA